MAAPPVHARRPARPGSKAPPGGRRVSGASTRRALALALTLGGLLAAGAAGAQGAGASYTFDGARDRMAASSSAMAAARANADASRSSADAVGAINLPIVSIDAQAFRYQKTLEVSLDALRNAAGAVNASINGFLASLPTGALPAGSAARIGNLGADALARIPDALNATLVRATGTSSPTRSPAAFRCPTYL